MKDPEPLLKAVQNRGKTLIAMHNNPDPDSFGAALGLQHLLREAKGIESVLAYGGIVGRAENRKFLELLDIKASRINRLDLRNYRQLALVDAQPAAGNHCLPDRRKVMVCLDHHPPLDNKDQVRFLDVDTTYGAASILIADYLLTAGIDIPQRLATALCYGIKTDTLELTRGVSPQDITIYMKLYQKADKPTLGDIISASEPIEYYAVLSDALKKALRTRDLVIVVLDEVPYADVVAEVADFFLRLEEIKCTACIGYYRGETVASVRSATPDHHAGKLIRKALGRNSQAGGHQYAGGGRVNYGEGDNPKERSRKDRENFVDRLLKQLELSGVSPVPLFEYKGKGG